MSKMILKYFNMRLLRCRKKNVQKIYYNAFFSHIISKNPDRKSCEYTFNGNLYGDFTSRYKTNKTQ